MSYLNRFIIEEDTQFECTEVVEWKSGSSWENLVQDLKESFNRLVELRSYSEIYQKSGIFKQVKFSKKSNSDFIRHLFLSFDFYPVDMISEIYPDIYPFSDDRPFKSFIDGIRTSPEISHMITRIGSQRLEYVQKERYEKLYTEGGQIKYNEVGSFEVHQSIVNDIDDFYDRIKMNKINFAERRLLTDYMYKSFDDFFEFWDTPDSVKTFHLSMLTDEEERKIHSENTDNLKLDYFKNKTTLSRNEPNYVLAGNRDRSEIL